MFKAKQKRVSLVVACLTALCAMFFAFVGIFSVPTTTASAADTVAYSYTFTSSQFSANGSKTLNNVGWTLAGDGGYWGYDGTKGQQFGSGSKPYKSLTLTSSKEFTEVSKIEINTSGASSVNASLTVKVGGTQIGNTTKIGSTATAYTFSSSTPLTGEVVLSYTQTSSKAIYIKSIVIYEKTSECTHENTTEVVTQTPTCTVAGSKSVTCTDCGDVSTVEILATGHNFENGYCVNDGCGEKEPTTKTDVLTRATTGATGTNYVDWSNKTATTDAVYAGNSAGGNESIQLRSNNNNSGIVTTASGGQAVKISVVWNSSSTAGRTLNIYGKNAAYSVASDLYDSNKQGTLIGTIVCGTSTELQIDEAYAFIGLRSASGAMYLTSISITWEPSACSHESTSEVITKNPTCTEIGSKSIVCDECEETISTHEIPATGHAWDKGTITTPPQVGVEGELTFTCQNGCGETTTESIPALDTVNYTVSYSVPSGVENVPSEEIAEGYTVVLPAADALAGYTFVGWTTEEYTANTAAPTTIYKTNDEYEVNEDTTFFALYSYILGSNDFTKLTDASKLAVGKEIVIVASGYNFALSTEDRGNNRGTAAITKSDNAITLNESVQIITLEEGLVANTYAFNIGNGYLYAASSSSNNLKTKTELDNNGSWLITINASGVATIKAQGSNSRNLLKFNSTNDPKIFSCYSSGQSDVAIYMKDSTIYYTTEIIAKIDSATITVGETLTVNYKVTLSEAFATAVMYFTYEGEDKTYDVTGVKQEDGRYSFSLPVPPQAMATNIKAELKYGEYLLATLENYSIKQYAQNKLNDSDSSPELKQLLTDMLYYGAAAQNYKGYNLENLATANVDNLGAPSTATPAAVTATPVKNTEVSSYPVYFTSATVWFSDVNMISVKINSLDGAKLLVDGVEVDLTSTTYTTEGILPTELDKDFVFELYHGDVLMQTLTYSVNAYAYKMQSNATMGELALALYRYGVSAKAYIN